MKVQRAHRSILRNCSSTVFGLSVTLLAYSANAQSEGDSDLELTPLGSATVDGDLDDGPTASSDVEAQTQLSGASAGTEGAEQASAAGSYPYAGARSDRRRYDSRTYSRQVPYIHRYKPEANLWEIGLFGGVLFPSTDHNIKVPSLDAREYSRAAGQFGGRLAYFPLSFLGAEIEGYAAGGAVRGSNYSAALYALRAHAIVQLPIASVVPFLLVGGGTMGALSEEMGHDRDPAFHFGGGVKIPVCSTFSFRIDGRDTMTQKGGAKNGKQTHHPELHLGATFTFQRSTAELPPDTDFDGLFDHEDQCPTVGALTTDGCPGDQDGDGIADLDDQCPAVAGEAPSGCPNLDEDGDGVPTPADQCPDEVGPAPTGCPDRDEDGDGFIGDQDKCPKEPETRNGFEDDDGCPDEMPEAMKRFTGVIQGINFKQGTAEIEAASHPTLDSAIETLKQYPSIRLEVSGHTSSEGTAERNQELSVERANSVRDYIVQNGVDGSRIVARGAGPSEPIADNATPEGRHQNRRIEFRILAQP